jgi:hypothetical protein
MGGLSQESRQGITFRGLHVGANQLGAQYRTALDDGGVLRGVTRGLLVGCERLLKTARRRGLVASLRGLLSTFGVRVHDSGLSLRRRGCLCLGGILRIQEERQDQGGAEAEDAHKHQLG